MDGGNEALDERSRGTLTIEKHKFSLRLLLPDVLVTQKIAVILSKCACAVDLYSTSFYVSKARKF